MKISEHISYIEATKSSIASKLGIDNTPNTSQLLNMKELAYNVFEVIRDYFKTPIYVSSFYRSSELNKVLKGAKNSQHLCNNGAAIDVDADIYGNISNLDIFFYILDNLKFDQLILEDVRNNNAGWVHVSYNKGKNRNKALLMYREEGKTKYEEYSLKRLNELLKLK